MIRPITFIRLGVTKNTKTWKHHCSHDARKQNFELRLIGATDAQGCVCEIPTDGQLRIDPMGPGRARGNGGGAPFSTEQQNRMNIEYVHNVKLRIKLSLKIIYFNR